jgi:hypothetical protein
MVEGWTLASRVLMLRLWNLLLTSAIVPAAWIAARRVLGAEVAMAVTASVALFPELMFDGARVSNSALAVALYALVVVASLEVVDGRRSAALWLGTAIGLGLLTKGFFLMTLPVFAGVLLFALCKRKLSRPVAALSVGLAALIPGWWYAHNLRVTGSFSTAIQDTALKGVPLGERLRHVVDVNWLAALDSTFFSHIWFGGWSFLQLRAWIYHVCALVVLAAAIGLAVVWRGGVPARRHLAVLAALWALFCAGIAYHVLLTYLANGISSSAGWYLCAVLVPEMILLAAGLRVFARRAMGAVAIALAVLDLYAMLLVALPYYSGLIAHRPNGMLEAFHVGRFGELRLGLAGWLYVAATLALAGIAQIRPVRAEHTSGA